MLKREMLFWIISLENLNLCGENEPLLREHYTLLAAFVVYNFAKTGI